MTSNLPFSRWDQVFGKATIASAMIDRIVHHADVIALKGGIDLVVDRGVSYRIKHTPIDKLPFGGAAIVRHTQPVNLLTFQPEQAAQDSRSRQAVFADR